MVNFHTLSLNSKKFIFYYFYESGSQKMSFLGKLKTLLCISLAFAPYSSSAEFFVKIEPKPISEIWLNPGFYSYHFQKNIGLNDNNYGLGVEYRYSTVSSVSLGLYENSDRQTSHYAGWYWQPIELGTARLGVVVGALDGYPKMQNGGWFLAAIPTASIEYRNVGANLMVIPSYQDKLYGSISLQLKLKIF